MRASPPNAPPREPHARARRRLDAAREAPFLTLPGELQARIIRCLDAVTEAQLASVHSTLRPVVAAAAAQRDWSRELLSDQITVPAPLPGAPAEPAAAAQPAEPATPAGSAAPAEPAAAAEPTASAAPALVGPTAAPEPGSNAQTQAASRRRKAAYLDFFAGSVTSRREICGTACYEALALELPARVPTLSRRYAAVPVAHHALQVCENAFGRRGEVRSPRPVARDAAQRVSQQLGVLLEAIEDPDARAQVQRRRAAINDPTLSSQPSQAPGAPRSRRTAAHFE